MSQSIQLYLKLAALLWDCKSLLQTPYKLLWGERSGTALVLPLYRGGTIDTQKTKRNVQQTVRFCLGYLIADTLFQNQRCYLPQHGN